jgi:hypothetical protein
MLWSWWAVMGLMGLILGAVGAWTTGAARVFMKTLAIPIGLVITRLFFPLKASPYYLGYLLLDLLIVTLFAFVGDYWVGLQLGRNDRDGYREDTVGH